MSQEDSVKFGSTRIDYVIERTSRRKTIGITVRPDASVRVAAPKGTRKTTIASKVDGKAAWILKQQECCRRNARRASRKFVSGESLPYLGRQYQLRLASSREVGAVVDVRLYRGSFEVVTPAGLDGVERARTVRAALVRWYRDHSLPLLEAGVEVFADRLGIAVPSVQIRDMPSRWGSAGPEGPLRFNWRIAMAPKRLVDYVAAHEVCHLRHPHHSPAFWRLLGRVIPDYAQRRGELQLLGARLTL